MHSPTLESLARKFSRKIAELKLKRNFVHSESLPVRDLGLWKSKSTNYISTICVRTVDYLDFDDFDDFANSVLWGLWKSVCRFRTRRDDLNEYSHAQSDFGKFSSKLFVNNLKSSGNFVYSESLLVRDLGLWKSKSTYYIFDYMCGNCWLPHLRRLRRFRKLGTLTTLEKCSPIQNSSRRLEWVLSCTVQLWKV
jgi:hypothetical protein